MVRNDSLSVEDYVKRVGDDGSINLRYMNRCRQIGPVGIRHAVVFDNALWHLMITIPPQPETDCSMSHINATGQATSHTHTHTQTYTHADIQEQAFSYLRYRLPPRHVGPFSTLKKRRDLLLLYQLVLRRVDVTKTSNGHDDGDEMCTFDTISSWRHWYLADADCLCSLSFLCFYDSKSFRRSVEFLFSKRRSR